MKWEKQDGEDISFSSVSSEVILLQFLRMDFFFKAVEIFEGERRPLKDTKEIEFETRAMLPLVLLKKGSPDIPTPPVKYLLFFGPSLPMESFPNELARDVRELELLLFRLILPNTFLRSKFDLCG